MRRKKDQRPGRYERSGGRRAWEWLLVQVKHTWYQAGPQTPNTMDLHGHFTPSSQDQARQEYFSRPYRGQ